MRLRLLPTPVGQQTDSSSMSPVRLRLLGQVMALILLSGLVACGHTSRPLPALDTNGMSAQVQPVGELLEQARRAESRGRYDEALGLNLQALKMLQQADAADAPEVAASRQRASLHAKAGLVRLGQRQQWSWLDSEGREIQLPDGSSLMVIHEQSNNGRGTLDPREWSDIEPAIRVVANELPQRVTTDGAGVPLVMSREVNSQDAPALRLIKLERDLEVIPATLLARLDETNPKQPRLHLRWQSTLESVDWAGHDGTSSTAVAADFSAPLEVFGAAGGFRAPALLGILRPDRFPDSIELFRMTPEDPRRVPVVLVHGLASEPRTWRVVVNELMRDPVVRERCEFYYFAYPTSQPLPYAASELRNGLAELQHAGLAGDGEVLLIGHSLGGVISKTQVVASGNHVWNLYFNTPPEETNNLGPITQRLTEWLVFEPSPVVGRVVFIAAPHGGSEIADSWLGNIGRRLANVPRHAIALAGSIVTLDVEVLTDTGRQVASRFPTVVDTLSVNSPLLQTLRPLPVVEGIGTHTIYGNRNAAHPDRPCTDGVVRCDSARLPGMDSELMVMSGHSAHESPEAIAELLRIIRLHLDEVDRR